MSSSQRGEADRADDRRRPEHAAEDAAALVDARRAADEDPRAVEALEDREPGEQRDEQRAEPEQDAPADAVGAVLDLRRDPQRAGRDRAPEQEVQDDHEREERVGEQRVRAPPPPAAALGRGAVPGRRGARPPADEQAAGVGRVRAHCVEGYGASGVPRAREHAAPVVPRDRADLVLGEAGGARARRAARGSPATSPSSSGIVAPSKSEPSATCSTPMRSAT